jgi:hypothetical protein
MRGDGRTPRGLQAQQTTSHAAGRTTRSVAPNHGTRAKKKGLKHQQRRITQAISTAANTKQQAKRSSSADAITAGGSLKRHPPRQPRSRPTPNATTKNPTTSTPLQKLRTDTQQKCARGKRAYTANAIAYCQRALATAKASTCPPHMHFKGWQGKQHNNKTERA